MVDEFQKVEHISWGQRISGSFMGVIFGILFFVLAFPLLWWNEGRSVDRIKTLNEGRGLVVSVAADHVDPANEGRLIHVTGLANTNEILKDPVFGVEEKALKLKRVVETYQWDEDSHTNKEKNLGGSETRKTTYRYKKVWSEFLIDSSGFEQSEGHKNPSTKPYSTQEFTAPDVFVGRFRLDHGFALMIGGEEEHALNAQSYAGMPESMQSYFKPYGQEYFYGNPKSPQIGAMRVFYKITKPHDVSVIGKQSGSSVAPYKTKNGGIELVRDGLFDAEEMFDNAESGNSFWTWVLRVVGFLVMWSGLSWVLRPLSVLADVVPLFGYIVEGGIDVMTGIISFALSFLTIALAWIFFRPLIGIALLVVAVSLFFYGGQVLNKARNTLLESKNQEAA